MNPYTAPTPGDLFDAFGQRKYLCADEQRRFLAAAQHAELPTRVFCRVLIYTGSRISEALTTSPRLIDRDGKRIVFRTLKRRRCVYRAVPIPDPLLQDLLVLGRGCDPDERLWPWCRQTAWRHVKAVMDGAGIVGPQATPRGCRHQFGVRGIESGMPEALLQRLMGNAKASNTAIYTCVVGAEERALTQRMWDCR